MEDSVTVSGLLGLMGMEEPARVLQLIREKPEHWRENVLGYCLRCREGLPAAQAIAAVTFSEPEEIESWVDIVMAPFRHEPLIDDMDSGLYKGAALGVFWSAYIVEQCYVGTGSVPNDKVLGFLDTDLPRALADIAVCQANIYKALEPETRLRLGKEVPDPALIGKQSEIAKAYVSLFGSCGQSLQRVRRFRDLPSLIFLFLDREGLGNYIDNTSVGSLINDIHFAVSGKLSTRGRAVATSSICREAASKTDGSEFYTYFKASAE